MSNKHGYFDPYGILAPYRFTLHYRNGGNDTIRVWREDWFGDQFEVLSALQFNQLQTSGIILINHTNDED